ncbi:MULTISPECIES: hypothetical protein [Listeria]|uniref:hypothetical protein n=1 Tax=Listeria TaxID=1637 RepID=UPI000B58BA65|nr:MULTISPECIES: hypothetical protein [Listeria]
MRKKYLTWGSFILIILLIIGIIVAYNVYKSQQEEQNRKDRIIHFSDALSSAARAELEQYGLTRYLTPEEAKELKNLYYERTQNITVAIER